MTFAPKDLCEKLEKMGCKSESRHFWAIFQEPLCEGDGASVRFWPELENFPPKVPAFTLEDFVGTHEQAKENARIVWLEALLPTEEKQYNFNALPEIRWRVHRHSIIDSNDWVKYLQETIK